MVFIIDETFSTSKTHRLLRFLSAPFVFVRDRERNHVCRGWSELHVVLCVSSGCVSGDVEG